MLVNNLLESSNNYKSMQEDAARLSQKWAKSGLLEGIADNRVKDNMAVILENQAKQIVAEANTTGTGGTFSAGAGEQWAGVALPLVRKVFASIVAQDFVSVQPMNLPSGLVFYLDFKYGTSNGGFNESDNMYGNVSSASNKMSVDEEVDGGLYGAGRFGYSINSGSVDLTTDNAVHSAATSASINYQDGVNPSEYDVFTVDFTGFDFDVTAVRAFRLISGSTDVTSNPELTTVSGNSVAFVVTASVVDGGDGNITVGEVKYHVAPQDNSRGDFEASTGAVPDTSITIPEIDVKLASEAIVAKTRKLKAQWTPEFAQDLNAYHSIDAEAELTSLLSEYISMEIDLEILDMLIQGAVTTERWSAVSNKVWNSNTNVWDTNAVTDGGFYNTQGQWFQTLGTKIQKVSNKIHQKTLRGGANFLVCSPTVATVLESIPGYAANTDGDKMEFNMGVERVGSLANRFKVYKNPYMTENTILLGYRGSQFLETGAVYAPYVPLMMTPLVYDPDTFTPRKGLMTRYAKKMIRPEFYGKIFVSDITTI